MTLERGSERPSKRLRDRVIAVGFWSLGAFSFDLLIRLFSNRL